jgi:thiol-disulfide isomerase/thioredoxin
MEEQDTVWPQYIIYTIVMLCVFLASTAFGQIEVKQFNAGWNSANDVGWVQDLEDCRTIGYTDVAKNTEAQTKYKIAVVPTIIIFKDGEEVARFQADLSFKMIATREEVQEEISNQLMSDF